MKKKNSFADRRLQDKLLLESVEQYGRNWKAIGSIYFKRRTSLGLKNRHSLLLRHIDSSRLGRGSKKSTIVASAATSRSASVARYPNDSDGDDNEADASDRESSVEEEREYICSGSKKRSSRQSASRPPTRPTSSAKRPSEFSDSGNREAPSSFGLSPRGQGAGFMTAAAAAVAATTAGADSLCQTSISVPSSSTSAVVGQHDGIADQVADYELSESPADGSGSSGPRFTDFNIDPTLAFDPMQQGFGPHPDLEMTTAATTASDVMTAATSSAAAMTAANAMAPMAADPTMADMPSLRELSSFAFPCGLESEDSFSLSESAQGGVYPTTQAGSMGLVSPISSSSPHDGSAFPLHSSMQGSAAYRDAIAMGLEGFCDSNARKQVTLTVNCASERLGELLQVTMEAVNSVTSSEENANVLLNVK
ncbi:MAG: hypothetical protein M1825_001518 [Sarcosagium campestre]|nr:MAG: hypothetical protein M1825_001518 [Sarcosagium campestre]